MIVNGISTRTRTRSTTTTSPIFAFGLGRVARHLRGAIRFVPQPLPEIPGASAGARPLFRGKDGVALTERVLLPVTALPIFKEHAGFPASAALIAVASDGTRIYSAGSSLAATRLFVKIEGMEAEVYFADGAAM